MHPDNEIFTKEQMARWEMFDKQQRIATRLSKIDEMNKESFLNQCPFFDQDSNIEYQMPTPEDVYKEYSSYDS